MQTDSAKAEELSTGRQHGLELRVFAEMDECAADLPGLGIALSGGGDSIALMHLIARWGAARHCRIATATVDHGLRSDSGKEAMMAGQAAEALGLEHTILRWGGRSGGNLMDQARRARIQLLGKWAQESGLPAVALGHTQDDQAETLLMRLSRGAGVDGLAAMSSRRVAGGTIWLRPLLGTGRKELRDWLRNIGIEWIDDPTNEDPRFERVRIRQAIAHLGIVPEALARSAENLAEVRDTLNECLIPLLKDSVSRMGSLLFDRKAFDAAPVGLQRRLILAAIKFITNAEYPPRRAGVDYALKSLSLGHRVTLDGTILDPGDCLLVHREPAAANHSAVLDKIWDYRWIINGLKKGDVVRAIAEDIVRYDWRTAGLCHLEAQALPAVERDGQLYCPALVQAGGLVAKPVQSADNFYRMVLGH